MWKTRQENPPAGSSVTNKRTFLVPGCRTGCPGRWRGKRGGNFLEGRLVVRRCLRCVGKLSSLLGRTTNAQSRWRGTAQGRHKKRLCNDRIEFMGFGLKGCESCSCSEGSSVLPVGAMAGCKPSSASGDNTPPPIGLIYSSSLERNRQKLLFDIVPIGQKVSSVFILLAL